MKLQIQESTELQESEKDLLKLIINQRLSDLRFKYGAFFNVDAGKWSIGTQEVVLVFENHSIQIFNHYHESKYYTGLQYLLIRESPSQCDYLTHFKDSSFDHEILAVELWGHNYVEDWDIDRIKHHISKGEINVEVERVDNLISSQHILRIVLSDSSSIVIRSDSPNLIIINCYSKDDTEHFLGDYYFWQKI